MHKQDEWQESYTIDVGVWKSLKMYERALCVLHCIRMCKKSYMQTNIHTSTYTHANEHTYKHIHTSLDAWVRRFCTKIQSTCLFLLKEYSIPSGKGCCKHSNACFVHWMQHTHCNTLQHTHCNTLQHTYCNALQHTYCNTLQHTYCNTLQHTYCNTLQHTLQGTANVCYAFKCPYWVALVGMID